MFRLYNKKLSQITSTCEANFMSKKLSKKHSAKPDKTSQSNNVVNHPITSSQNGAIAIKVRAKPGAKTDSVTDIDAEGVGIQISSPPVDGEANTALVRYVASILGVRKSDVSLDKGSKSRQKTLLVTAKLSVEEVTALLQQAIDKNL